MSAETESDSLSILTADNICDLCGCIRHPILNRPQHLGDEVEVVALALQTLLDLCESVNQTSFALQYEFMEMIARQNILQQTISQLKIDRDTLLQRLACIENLYESKCMLSRETNGLIEKTLTVLRARFAKGKKGSIRSEA